MTVSANTTQITVDFTARTGNRIKPMHGVGQPPIIRGMPGVNPQLFHYLEEAGIPYSRLHDAGGSFGGGVFVDVPNIFRDFDADEDDPASYDFVFTDILIQRLKDYNVETFYRLGITIENAADIKAYHVYPPKDFAKWARICEHIIRHYNEGWANGFTLGIRYWEIWNEPDVCFNPNETAQTWHGGREEFFRFYETASKHLKACFGDTIAVGGYASIGFLGHEEWDPCLEGVDQAYVNADNPRAYRIDYAHRFLSYVREHHCPLDYFSWHCYSSPAGILECADYCRRLLTKYGFGDTPDILNEWNTYRTNPKYRGTPKVAADTFAVLLGAQKTSTALLCYYDARIGQSVYGGMFDPMTYEPLLTYYGFKSFNMAYKLGEETESASSDPDVYVLSARNAGKGILLIANTKEEELTLHFDIKGAGTEEAEVLITDEQYLYTYLGEIIKQNQLTVKAHSCIEIRFAL